MAKFWQFTVQGNGEFPVDMLRYDSCWPRTTDDVVTAFPAGPRPRLGTRTVTLVTSMSPPTPGRWASFGWTVTELLELR